MADKKSRVNPYPTETTKAVIDGKVSVNGKDLTHRDPKGDGQGFNPEGVTALVTAAEKSGCKLRPIF